jgi:hypothetical protein
MLKFFVIAKTFQKNEALVSSSLCDSALDESNYQSQVIMHSAVS